MTQLKPVTTGGLLKDVNDNFAAISTVGTFAGLHLRRTAVAVFEVDETLDDGLGADDYELDVVIPANAVIVGGVVDVVKPFTSENDTATIAISLVEANDIVAAKAIGAEGDPWDAGLQAIIPKANTPESTGINLTADTPVTVTVGVEALTAGKFVLYLDYYEGIETETEE